MLHSIKPFIIVIYQTYIDQALSIMKHAEASRQPKDIEGRQMKIDKCGEMMCGRPEAMAAAAGACHLALS